MDNNFRILNCLSDPRLGGPQRRALLNAERLRAKANIETEFLLPDGANKFKEMLQSKEFIVHQPGLTRLHPPHHLGKNLKYIFSFTNAAQTILNLIEERNIEIIHVNSPMNLYPAIGGWLSSRPVIWHFNGYNFPSILMRAIKQIAPVIADDFIFSSSVVRDHIFHNEFGGAIIFPPVDIDAFDPANANVKNIIRDEFNIDESVPVIGTVGNITPAKDHELLLHSVKRVVDNWGEIAVPIVGGITDTKRDYFLKIRDLRDELDLETNVFFLGWRSNIHEILPSFDLFVLSSKMETGPMSLMEAMAMEVPVVTTCVGVVKDVEEINDFSWVVPPESEDDFTRALLTALESEDQWQTIGSHARRCAKRHFSLAQSATKHERVYRSLVDM